ncbi:RNA polymerase sigma-70 factor, ECF subfamily [Fodinibius salinus]|uniref:RNA polymerase sigma-70 factor, ECF subfamily n=1 Tax=Fodinibius salinus TaxID=860790 RepID=A0A5D3YGH2_9BACT|nr:sigma-70 family RNA polymerase sigma factor [Fodinibius salinus]TYP92521.1 RNA polymerase sigma-70 factor, ECF subfamily [Fodinibius salinus]
MLRWFKNKNPQPPYSNDQWVDLLSEPVNEQAVDELSRQLIRGLKPALHKYVDRELQQFVEDVAQDSILKVLNNIETFRGESKFMTWAMKIAVREGLTELRRKRWDNVSLDEMKAGYSSKDREEFTSRSFAGNNPSPETDTAQKMVVEKIEQMIEELLTKRQQRVIEALLIENKPSFLVAKEMDTNRNNLYKLLYDARKKLKNELEVQGIDPKELLQQISES